MARSQDHPSRMRPLLTLLGALAGLCAWFLSDVLQGEIDDARLFLLLAAATGGGFFMLLALVGPNRLLPSLPWSLAIPAVVSGLLYWASFRYDTVESYLGAGYPLAAFCLFLIIATPFAAAHLRGSGRGPRYADLFDLGWRIFVRYLAAVLFTVLFWALLALSDALFTLVGLHLLTSIRQADPLAWVMTGAVFGLALGVLHELREYLSPYLVLRLLRLLLPVVLIVVAVFLLALPVQGLSNLVGNLSAAGTLMTAALVSIVLITVAVDRDGVEEVRLPWMRVAVQSLALLVPLLVGLAIHALGLRIAQYGWTPQRVVASTVAAVLLLYGLAYGGAVALRVRWPDRIRGANVVLALAVLGVIAILLSPALVPERIAAQSQVARYLSGSAAAEQMPLERMARAWGRAGVQALDRIGGDAAIAGRIAALGQLDAPLSRQELRRDVAARLPVQGGDPLRPAQLRDIDDAALGQWRQACIRTVAGGPGCVLVFGDFMAGGAARSGLLLLQGETGGVSVQSVRMSGGQLRFLGYVIDLLDGAAYDLPQNVLEAVHAGNARVAPPGINALIVGEHALFPHN